MQEYDAVIVGAGPGGSRTAKLLAEQGHHVAVLEEHQSVGLPVHCSGFVTPRTLTEAGLRDDTVLNAINGAIVHGPSGKPLTLGGDRVRAYVLDRRALDCGISETAQERGAELHLSTRVTEIEWHDSHVMLTARRKGQEIGYRARLVIGADGVRSQVAKSMGRSSGEMIWCIGAEARLSGHPPDMARIYVGRQLAPGWFAWTIPLEPGRVRIGVGGVMRPGADKPRHLLNTLFRSHPAHFRGVEVESFGGGMIPLYAKVRTYGDRALLVGDAALQVKPTSGGGIYTSLVAARHAAAAADAGLDSDRLDAASLATYEINWRSEIGDELERGVDVRQTYLSLTDRELDRLIDIFRQPLLRPIINRYGDIDYPSRMFGHLLGLAPLLKPFLGVPDILPFRWTTLVNPRRWRVLAKR